MSTEDIFPEEEGKPLDTSQRVRKKAIRRRLFTESDYEAFDDENLLEFDEDEEALIYLDS
ncbi:MAG: hypothetical protein ACFB15_30050 [Cyclobacteriaceae bacterium]